jgi:hypothetical protein
MTRSQALRQLLDQARALLSAGFISQRESDVWILTQHVRLLETLVEGEPTTPLPERQYKEWSGVQSGE